MKPGTTITPDNAEQVRDLVSPGVFYLAARGMHMNITPTERLDWPPPYKDATEKYSSQVRLSQDHRSVIGYVSGQPFPLIDVNDPDVGAKIVWNNVFRPISSDDYDLRFFDCESEYVRPDKDQNIVDDIHGFSTMCYLPGRQTPERECWYINMGAINKDFCTVQAMTQAAP